MTSKLMAGPPPGKTWKVDGPTWERMLAEIRPAIRAEIIAEHAAETNAPRVVEATVIDRPVEPERVLTNVPEPPGQLHVHPPAPAHRHPGGLRWHEHPRKAAHV